MVVETRQAFDIPLLHHETTEHQVPEARCPCGQVHRGEFPVDVTAPVQYGPRIKAVVVHLTHHHMMPLARTGDPTGDLFGLPLADATVLAINAEARKAAPLAHAHETGMCVAGNIHWLHVLATTTLTWIGAHVNRGKKAFDAFGILTVFAGTLIHDR